MKKALFCVRLRASYHGTPWIRADFNELRGTVIKTVALALSLSFDVKQWLLLDAHMYAVYIWKTAVTFIAFRLWCRVFICSSPLSFPGQSKIGVTRRQFMKCDINIILVTWLYQLFGVFNRHTQKIRVWTQTLSFATVYDLDIFNEYQTHMI